MCTLTFFPFAEGFILTSNRDEKMRRSNTLPPKAYPAGDDCFFYPRDQESSGTWIACSASGKTFCLLNGAFEKHLSSPPYRKSRGLILLDILAASDAGTYLADNSLEGIEPFTLVMLNQKEEVLQLAELRWDGRQHYLKNLDSTSPQIWSSATLYVPEIRAARESWFHTWLQQHPNPLQEDLLAFHRFGGNGDVENNLLMTRPNDRQTISITSVFAQNGKRSVCYEDLVSGERHQLSIE